MVKRKKSYLGIVVSVCIMLVCTVGFESAAQEKPKFGGTLIVGIPVDPFSLNPIVTTSLHTAYVTGQIYNRLVRSDWSGKLLPELAESWEISKDGLTYTFHLVKNACGTTGSPSPPLTSNMASKLFKNTIPRVRVILAQLTGLRLLIHIPR